MADNKKKKEIDEISGVETTGHEWDGLKELNNPLPRWWLWVFYVTIIWGIGICIVYPSWPTLSGATKGTSGYTQLKELEASQKEIFKRQEAYTARFENASFDEIMNDPELYAFALAGGRTMFKDNCATCHGTGAQGSKGYPNLNDDDWLWGGKLDEIHMTILHGIRADNLDSHVSQMPSFGRDKILSTDQINDVVDYVLALSDKDKANTYTQGKTIYREQCAFCHGNQGLGDQELGAPNLADSIWLYGGTRKDVFETIYSARVGMMPAWNNRLDAETIRRLTIYIHQLGGGEEISSSPKKQILPIER